ncbi:MAG: type II toxin-antitoxin system VapC family toxin [Pseudonocardiaceae bacterium]
MTVVDASIIVRLLANRPADEDLRRRFSALRTVHAPHLIDAEVASATRELLLGRKIALPRARNNLTAYDAVYVALSETLRMPLLTQDPKLGRAAGHHAEVHIFT